MNKLILPVLLFFATFSCLAQDADSLLKQLNPDSLQSISSTFKSTRIVLVQSSETQKKYDLDFRVRHHFGDIGGNFGGSHTLFGLDAASDLFIGLDYGISDKFTIGIGRSRQDELYNLLLKYKLLEQSPDKMPFTLTLFGQGGWIMRKPFSSNEFNNYSSRFSYFFQGIVARRFSHALSLELLPGYLIRNQATDVLDNENLFSLGFAGRLKLTKRLSFVADYQLVNAFGRPSDLSETYYNPLGVGLEIETGGHIFSLNFMNSEYIVENNFIPNTKKSWQNGGVRFGFTISRNFTLKKPKNKDIESKIY
ncbi:DUF5777 family beta-barrel protein [Rubrolithibacter danxiaensis]|uniref:DUF5777 family beta-barrel protein n=1 Tax=Rubrolithibacter danxiaensis TaxID=3390805 RepID=UPI003BF81275